MSIKAPKGTKDILPNEIANCVVLVGDVHGRQNHRGHGGQVGGGLYFLDVLIHQRGAFADMLFGIFGYDGIFKAVNVHYHSVQHGSFLPSFLYLSKFKL